MPAIGLISDSLQIGGSFYVRGIRVCVVWLQVKREKRESRPPGPQRGDRYDIRRGRETKKDCELQAPHSFHSLNIIIISIQCCEGGRSVYDHACLSARDDNTNADGGVVESSGIVLR